MEGESQRSKVGMVNLHQQVKKGKEARSSVFSLAAREAPLSALYCRPDYKLVRTGVFGHSGRMKTPFRFVAPILSIATLAFVAPSAFANDSEAELALGGLVLKANADISMDSEDLFLSAKEVRVNYIYTNHSDQDREVLISFPLPPQPDFETFISGENQASWEGLEFQTTVNGEPVDYEIADRAVVPGGRDVTEQVLAEGLPINWPRDYNPYEAISKMSEAEKQRLLGLGLLKNYGENGSSEILPAWQMQRHIIRKQVFAAGTQTRVSHRYDPLLGGSLGGGLERNDEEEIKHYQEKWCTDDNFMAAVQQKLSQGTKERPVYTSETWLGYILSSGANWRGPIKKFRLVVDKGSPDRLVSFCMDGVKKISPTQFEVVKQDFEPKQDLNILLVSFHRPIVER